MKITILKVPFPLGQRFTAINVALHTLPFVRFVRTKNLLLIWLVFIEVSMKKHPAVVQRDEKCLFLFG